VGLWVYFLGTEIILKSTITDTNASNELLLPPFPLLNKPIVLLCQRLNSLYNFQFWVPSVESIGTQPGGNETAQENHFIQSQDGYTCSYCPKHFVYLSDIKRHLRMHTGEKPYPCPACSYRASIYSHLKNHVRTVHTGVLIPKYCKDFEENLKGNKSIC